MSTYAELNTDNLVTNVIVADAEFVATQIDKTYVEYTDDNAGIGWTYDPGTELFVPPVEPPNPVINS